MFRPAAIFIGLRYTRAKKRNHFISFISLMSMLGIALGVLVLITVLSVMNGFDKEIKKRVFGMVPAITVSSLEGFVKDWKEVKEILHQNSTITAVAPFVSGEVLLTNEGFVQPAMLTGILPAEEKKISHLIQNMVQGNLTDLKAGRFGIVLGEELASRLGARVGDKITVMTPQFSISPVGIIPRYKIFSLVGLFHAGSGFGFDMSLGFINLTDAQKLFQMGGAVTGLHASIQDVYAAPRISEQLQVALGPRANIMNWTDQFGAFFQAVNLEKRMMFLILLLIIAVAVFNLVCTLVMVVNEKRADIAILRTFGATPSTIMTIFIVQGAVIGAIGTLLGIIGGIALALNVTELVQGIEHIFHVQFLTSSVNFVDYLPSQLQSGDVWRISLCALGLSLMATLYPAWRAACTEPVETLRYE